MAYTDFRGIAVVLQNDRVVKAAATEALKVGALADKEFALADASAAGGRAEWVALEDIASGDTGSFAKWAVFRKPTVVSVTAGGSATVGDHSGTLGDTLFLSTTAGKAVEVIDGDGIYQVVGQVLSTEDILLAPSIALGDFYEDCEKESTAKTVDTNDCGKAIVCCGTSDYVVTLQATVVGDNVVIINGAQDGDHEISASPNSSDGIVGWDGAATDNKDFDNTKATSKAGDRLELVANGVAGWNIVGGRGVWAAEA
jgi:hypothetical protein